MDQMIEYAKVAGKYLTWPLFEVSGSKISIVSFIVGIFILWASRRASFLFEEFIGRMLQKNKHLDVGVRGSIKRFSRYFILILGFLMALDTVGISLSSLAAIGAVLMVGIGFGLQNITQNFISGLIILFERPIKEGDLVVVNDITGRIQSIGARSTMITTLDDTSIIVPNSQFISEQVLNQSFSGDKMRLHLKVGVAYGSDCDLVQEVLSKVAKEHPKVINSPAPKVFFTDFGESSLDFSLTVWVHDLWFKEVILSDLRFAVDKAFRENKIEIPFPQRDLHVRSGLDVIQRN